MPDSSPLAIHTVNGVVSSVRLLDKSGRGSSADEGSSFKLGPSLRFGLITSLLYRPEEQDGS